jgi:trehalose 6-phosphate phosphatase
MLYLFDHLDLVEEVLTRRPCGLFTDIDGTISELAPSPQEARVSPICHRALADLAHHLPLVAAVSGRPIADMRRMIAVENMVYIGNHGLERWLGGGIESQGEDYRAKIAQALAEVRAFLALDGIVFEDKGITASIHYRRCSEQGLAREAILKAIARSAAANGLRIYEGRKVIELRPPLPVDKGTAILDLVRRYGLKGVIYLGDDATDVDAFIALRRSSKGSSFKGLSVAVTAPEALPQVATQADLILRGVADVERFLLWLTEAVSQAEPRYP